MLLNSTENEVWKLTDDKEACVDAADNIGYFSETATIYECARKCHELAPMFAYGTNDFGQQGCQDGLCKCHCVHVAESDDENCQIIEQETYRFFWYKLGANPINNGKIHSYVHIVKIGCVLNLTKMPNMIFVNVHFRDLYSLFKTSL